ncbi:hypothetical protein EMCRGX_G021256 [Ephydatia muelleri]
MSVEGGTATKLSLSKLSRMLNIRHRDYGKVEDMLDTRVPLHNDDAFQHGIKLKAKFIGSLEITKPSGKMDIITAMRKIRYEFKSKGIKKVRAQLDISTSGVKVSKRKRMRRRAYSESELMIMQHPIYRIFYVSHDSQDLKIFSYITREVADNTFRCNVFKAYKNSMALHIVRSLGQAFEVCHKLNPRPMKKKSEEEEAAKSEQAEDKDTQKTATESVEALQSGASSNDIGLDGTGSAVPTIPIQNENAHGNTTGPHISGLPGVIPSVPLQSYASRPRPRPGAQQTVIQENPFTELPKEGRLSPTISLGEPLGVDAVKTVNPFGLEDTDGMAPPSLWEMEKQQLCAQLALLGQQLQTETTARMEAQAQVHHLLAQNKELLAHMQKLIIQIQQLQAMPPKPQVKPVAPSVVDLLLDPIEPPVAIAAT